VIAPWLASAWEGWARRVAAGRIPHALLVQGPAGLGKRAFVQAVIASLLCQSRREDGHACGLCRGCTLRLAGTHPDQLSITLEDDAREIKVDQIRRIGARVATTSQLGGLKTVMFDPADRMNAASANALLKTLEEPAADSVLVLVADQPGRLPATIRSRCQRIDVRFPPRAQALGYLAEHGVATETAEVALALAAGNPGQAHELARADTMKRAAAVTEDLAGLATARAPAVQVVTRWMRDEPVERLLLASALLRWAQWRRRGTGPAAALIEPVVRALGAADDGVVAGLVAQADRVREQLSTPLRADLIVVEWLAELAGIHATPRRRAR
jgi:DNA polymerase-3 subunit delta'